VKISGKLGERRIHASGEGPPKKEAAREPPAARHNVGASAKEGRGGPNCRLNASSPPHDCRRRAVAVPQEPESAATNNTTPASRRPHRGARDQSGLAYSAQVSCPSRQDSFSRTGKKPFLVGDHLLSTNSSLRPRTGTKSFLPTRPSARDISSSNFLIRIIRYS